ncbi:MAG TPA: N-methyl-L-tryptophan oxidase [Vicinamibacterales bacterium]|nr:N-methyl-L-tryptophan oxidase [Vicinamibacterales bacterium]
MIADVIVAGAGGMGAAAACHLASRGQRVLVLERFTVGHDRGSSHGLTRIIRLAYFEHPLYVPLLRRAFELWRALEESAREPLLHVTGSLDVGAPGSMVFEGSKRSCLEHSLRHEILGGAALRRRFPAWHIEDGAAAVFQPDGGFLVPERCVLAHAAGARAAGATIHEHEPVLEWDARGDSVRVRTAQRTYEAGQLVLAAGAWMGSLLPDLATLMRPERQLLGWFGIAEPERFAPQRFPVFVHEADEGVFYGFPEFEVAGFKIGRYHHLSEAAEPNAIDRECRPADEAALRAAVSRYFPDANGPLLRSAVCMFTNTPDEHFIIDRHPVHPAVVVVSPCSGHGFKFCSVVGEIVADLVESGAAAFDLAPFRLGRFGGGGGHSSQLGS